MDDSSPDSKVVFRIVQDDGSVDVETPWATSLGDDLYRLENSPFYAYGVSWLDIVRAPIDPDEERPVFSAVVEKSGHSTVRVIFDPPAQDGNESQAVLDQLVELGASFEGASPSYMAIDIPPGVELSEICDTLTNKNIQWEHVDPTYEEIYGSPPNK
ncbi:MAG: DUF4265 domain-containing protein [bacterium]